MFRPTKKYTPVIAIGEPGLIHCLGSHGIPVYTVSEFKPNAISHSRFSKKHFTFSSYDSDSFIDELCNLGQELGNRAVLMSHDDRVLLNISRHRERLSDHFRFRLPPHEMVRSLLDKLQFCRLCSDYNLPAPVSAEVSDHEGLLHAADVMQPPYLIKPGYRHYWYAPEFVKKVGRYQKAFVCRTFDDLYFLYSKIAKVHPDVVIQEYIQGEDHRMYDVNLHINGSGRIDGYVICQKLRVYPPMAGWTCYARTVSDDSIFQTSREITERLGLQGLVNVQFKKDERTEALKLIEIHTRTSILDYQGAAAGQNLPLKYYMELTGTRTGTSEAVEGPGSGVDSESLTEPDSGSSETGNEPGRSSGPGLKQGTATGKKPVMQPDGEPARDMYHADVRYIHLARDLRLFFMHKKTSFFHLTDWIRSYRDTKVFDGMLLKDPKLLLLELYAIFRR